MVLMLRSLGTPSPSISARPSWTIFTTWSAGLHRLDDRLAGGFLARLGDEVAHHGQGHVGVEQGQAHFAQRFVHVGGRQHAATGQPVEDTRQTIA